MRRPSFSSRSLVPVGAVLMAMASCSDTGPGGGHQTASPTPAEGSSAVATAVDASGAPRLLVATSSMAPPAALRAPAEAARWQLAQHAARYHLSPETVAKLEVALVHDLGRGGVVAVFRQRVDGVEVLRREVKVLLRPNRTLVAIGGTLSPVATTGSGPAFVLAARDAVAAALADQAVAGTVSASAAPSMRDLGDAPGEYRAFAATGAQSLRAKKVYVAMEAALVAAYDVEAIVDTAGTDADGWRFLVDASTGQVLERQRLVDDAAYQYRVWANTTGERRPLDGPAADFTPHPTGMPDGSRPGAIAPVLVTMDGFNQVGGVSDPWLPAGATSSTGNNVDAYADLNSPDGFNGADFRATTTGAGAFDRSFNLSLSPLANQSQGMAAIVQAFYTTNWLHDWWYDSGFGESAGNAQQDNFGRGGLAGDRMVVEAQDAANAGERDNANMLVPADGTAPRMQIYLWTAADTASLTVTPAGTSPAVGTAAFGPQTFDVTGGLSLTVPADGCAAITNAVSGKIAVIDRGTCEFRQKAANAEAAGATGVVIVDNVVAASPPAMSAGTPPMTINTPTLSVTLAAGNALKTAMGSATQTGRLRRAAGVERDGALDNHIVAHEWGHYLHRRLQTCTTQLCSAQSEGWGDFVALHLSIAEADAANGVYGAAGFASLSFGDGYYYGIRRAPYTSDFTRNPLTFKHIQNSEPLPTSVTFNIFSTENAEVHNAGEIWTLLMFEAYQSLLADTRGATPRLTFAEAQRRMSDYVVAGLLLSPADSTFTETRDAILAAAAANDSQDAARLALGFARRGAGTCAVSPPSSSTTFNGVTEDYSVRPNRALGNVVLDDSRKSCDSDGLLDGEEGGRLRVQVLNPGAAALTGASLTVASTSPGVSFPSGQTVTVPSVPAYGAVTVPVDVDLAARTGIGSVQFNLTLTAPGTCSAASVQASVTQPVNLDRIAASSATDDVEAEPSLWTPTGTRATSVWSRVESTAPNHAWLGIDSASVSDTQLVSPPLVVAATGNFSVSFRHRYEFERSAGKNWDGGVIEISDDGGTTWHDVTDFAASPYVGTIYASGGNPLATRSGFIGKSSGYPAFATQTLSFGTMLAGRTIRLRFRIGADQAVGATGWELDDLAFTGITNTPFATVVADATTCPTSMPDAAPPMPDAAPPMPDAAPPMPDAAPPKPDAAPPMPDAAPPMPDAAPPMPDAAPPMPDAAPPMIDAAPPAIDAAPPGVDAATGNPDAGHVGDASDDGCGCRVARRTNGSGPRTVQAGVLFAGLLLVRRIKSRRRTSP